MEEDKPQILLWTATECPFRVTVPATVLNETRIHAVEAFYSVPRGGVEIGGVFFGVREPGAIHIQAHRPIRCEYATGPSFTLSISDQLGLSGLLDRAPDDPDLAGMEPLGWYHSHTRSELFLSPIDLQLYNEFFPEKWQIALVLRPTNLQPTRAGFFFRDRSGSLKSDAPIQEIKLEPPAFGLAPLDSIDLPQRIPVAAPPVPPLAGRGSPSTAVLADPPEIAPLAAAVSLLWRAPAPVTAPETPPLPPELPPAAIIDSAAPNDSDYIAAEAPPAGNPDAAPESYSEPVEIGLRSFDLAESAAVQKRKTGWIWALAIIILLTAGGGAAFLKWYKVGYPVGLGLEVYDINGAFLIRWDRLSSVILEASGATLEIEDGGEKSEAIPLTHEELAFGGYGYMRRTAHVSVHLKVAGAHPMEEYLNFDGVHALGSKPPESPEASNTLTQALEEKEHLKTELINESIQSTELRREITSLRRQLADERAKNTSEPAR